MNAKILLYDIETSPNLGYTWGKWEQNVIEFTKDMELLSFSWKWLGEKEVFCLTRADFKDRSDKSLVKALHKVLSEADIVIGHNANSYDNKVSNTRFIANGLPPVPPTKKIDTKLEAKRHFRFTSNSLDDLGKFLNVGRKIKHEGFQLWVKCMAGDKAAFKRMAKYNKQDVALLERVFKKLLPWIKNLNLNVYADKPDNCPTCLASPKSLISRGFYTTKVAKFRRFVCKKCNNWCSERTAEKINKISKVSK